MTRPGDPRDMLDVRIKGWDAYADGWDAGHRAGVDDATEARGGTRLAGCLVIMAAVAILCAISFTAGRLLL